MMRALFVARAIKTTTIPMIRTFAPLRFEHARIAMPPLDFEQRRFYSAPPGKKGFLGNLVDNVREELERNKELQESKKKLNERMQELNDSEALKEARKKFDIVEKESFKSSEVIKVKMQELTDQMTKMVREIQKTEAGKKLTAAGEEALKQARAAAEQIEKVAEKVGDTEVYKTVSTGVKTVQKEIDNITDVRMYSRPETLKKRSENDLSKEWEKRNVAANDDATDIQLHKDSKWYEGWKKFSEENKYYNKLLDWKIRYDESDNVGVRLLRGITERVAGVFSGSNEVSEVLTQIAKIDPKFDKLDWLRFCEKEVIPNILEAFIRMDAEVLEDWCYERAFVAMSNVIKEYKKIHFSTKDSRIIDINKVELVSGKMMEHGPVLIITFQAFMINVVKNAEGKVVHGDPNNPVRVTHVWVMCRDMEEFNPTLAWKLLEVHMQEAPLAI
ncbi:unnamed protein product, partial [Mesorhabditis belari]|uniref:Mitochondrial import inner membrane translocase subunit TIM44 n=1 Tax=Mesorhabditis belari TaxID=2138241 RepID=A0AAF3F573_9BILA